MIMSKDGNGYPYTRYLWVPDDRSRVRNQTEIGRESGKESTFQIQETPLKGRFILLSSAPFCRISEEMNSKHPPDCTFGQRSIPSKSKSSGNTNNHRQVSLSYFLNKNLNKGSVLPTSSRDKTMSVLSTVKVEPETIPIEEHSVAMKTEEGGETSVNIDLVTKQFECNPKAKEIEGHEQMSNKRKSPFAASSSKKRRGKNKSLALSKLRRGEKLPLEFSTTTNQPCCENRRIWVRHLGVVVRDKNVIPHRILEWKHIDKAQLDNMWKIVTEKFDNKNMSHYRNATLKHMHKLWNGWKSDLNRLHVHPYNNNLELILAHKPNEIEKGDWEWLVTHQFLTDSFKKKSLMSRTNRGKLKMIHLTGSKSFAELNREIAIRDGHPPTYEDLFLESRKQKNKIVDPETQLKYDEMCAIRAQNPSISNIDLAEQIFGPQLHGNVIGMGSGVLISQLRGFKQSKHDLQMTNLALKKTVDKLEADRAIYEAQRAADKATYEADKAEMSKKLSFLTNLMMAQFPHLSAIASTSN
ncbi:uncharacterized protein LOC124939352 [Impatiens glandulifera]|uniref:uncharacterized protein LOC124939352 n=1 Tax=Impatiens glandulifera TaxID=253017 RepID=UPI001FB14F8D|nr:uncharacterized protein LOC124939352 [Impatiens glandulifera]